MLTDVVYENRNSVQLLYDRIRLYFHSYGYRDSLYEILEAFPEFIKIKNRHLKYAPL
jgi:hypothetical protein